MSLPRWVLAVTVVVAAFPVRAGAQDWDDPAASALASRGVDRRESAEARDREVPWSATASGLLLFLTGLGLEPGAERLVKADELRVEVYWEAPGRSKQTIVAWRDHASLPTDLRYHRDHLGIVTSDFGPLIRLGDGEEVRDVPHPLSRAGLAVYAFALGDLIEIGTAGRNWRVRAVHVRPRDDRQPGVIGTLYLDEGSASVVRFRFTFTPASYRQRELEDITVVLENALQGGGRWLPWRQSIEIRRRPAVVDLPFRGVIRAYWELGDHRLGDEAEPQPLSGAPIAGPTAPGRGASWPGPLDDRVREVTGGPGWLDFGAARDGVRALVRDAAWRIVPPPRLAFGALSDLARVNRVEGLRLGLGASAALPGTSIRLAGWGAAGSRAGGLSGRLRIMWAGNPAVALLAEREVVDVGQSPVISPLLNSFLTQEFGTDHGDWVDRRFLGTQVRRTAGRGWIGVETGWRRLVPRRTIASDLDRGMRDNPAFRAADHLVLVLAAGGAQTAVADRRTGWEVSLEGGVSGPGRSGGSSYARVYGTADHIRSLAGGALGIRASTGWASRGVPDARGFVLGGWGTLPGTPFRAIGGRRMVWGQVEWLLPLPGPPVPTGTMFGNAPEIRVGPFVAAGWAGGGVPGIPWGPSGGVEPVAGLALEWPFGLVRAALGVALRGGGIGVSADIASRWWMLL